jgi:hypothetical protein
MKKNVGSKSRLIRREIDRKINSKNKIQIKDLKEILYKMKYNLSEDLNITILNKLDFKTRNYLLGCPLPNDYSELRIQGESKFLFSLSSELSWALMCFKLFSSEINQFLEKEKEFEMHFLLGNYEDCLEILNYTEQNICYSHWGLEKRILLSEYYSDKQSKNELISEIKDGTEKLIKINSSYQSVRFEKQLPPNKYDEIVNKFADRQKNSAVADYFLYKLNPFSYADVQFPEFCLYIESNLSIIDRYFMFFNIVRSIISKNQTNSDLYDLIASSVMSIAKIIDDRRLNSILVVLNKLNITSLKQIDKDFFKINELFNNNRFKDCYNMSLKFLETQPYILEVAEMLVKSAIVEEQDCPKVTESDSIINDIVKGLYNLYSYNSEYEISIYNLNKLAKSVSSNLWSHYLIHLINIEEAASSSINYKIYNFVSSFFYNPIIYDINVDKENKNIYHKLFEKEKLDIDSLYLSDLTKAYSQKTQINDGLMNRIQTIKSMFHKNEYTKSYEILMEVDEKGLWPNLLIVPFIKVELLRLKILLLYELGKHEYAIELICKNVILHEKFYFTLKNSDLINKVLESDDEAIQSNICTPILARMYRDRINDIWIAYDNYMFSNGLTYPNELFNSKLYDPLLLKYFLSQVCIQDIYDSSPDFNSPDELDNERIALCNYLCAMDSENKEKYINEITSIETKALIKRGIKEIDESKIYVDTNGIWRELETEVKERFTRGRELLKLKKEQIDYLLEMSSSVLYLYVSNNDEETKIIKFDKTATRTDNILNHPHFVNFKENFILIRDRFISSNEFGLDSYISMRIRHGTLLGQIRSIFERYNLITKKNTQTKQYINNDYWLTKLCQGKSKLPISDKLNNFSENIDLLSEKIKNSFLQIKTEEKSSDGLFDYKFEDLELIQLYETKFYTIEKHDLFFENAIDCLWKRTENNLNIIREKFINEFSKSVNSYLDDLASNIEKLNKNNTLDTKEFIRDLTACKTDSTNAFEKISLWFRRSYSNSINEFDINLVTTTCFSIVNKMHPQTPINSPDIQIISSSTFQGKYFIFFIDIMRNVLDNIIVRSELIEPQLKVKLIVKELNGKLLINIENNVAENIDLVVANNRIAQTQYKIDNSNNNTLLKKEGGSGYVKIKNILTKILKRKNYTLILEKISNDRIFKSSISFELKDLVLLK